MGRISVLLSLAIMLTLSACAPAPSGSQRTSAPGVAAAAPKKVVLGVTADVTQFNKQLAGNLRGMEAIELLVNTGLGSWDDPRAAVAPRLAEAVPSFENGLWKTFPDGTMETTWKIRTGAVWHDGKPFTSDDLVFTAMIDQDREIGVFRTSIYDALESVTAPDPRTVTVRWKQIYIDADQLFSTPSTIPLPKHLLEAAYTADKSTFTTIPYWSTQFIGLGPFKVQSFERGSHTTLVANDRFVLGRPRIDEITLRFVPDLNAFTANLMAGSIDLTAGTSISLDQAQAVKAQREMTIEFTLNGYWGVIYPQFIDPNPSAISDVRFRQALLYGIDRQGLIDSFIPGLSRVAHSVITPSNPDFDVVERQVVKYEYDPRRATAMLETLGFLRGADNLLADSAGRPLAVELRTTTQDLAQKTTFAVANGWEALGMRATTLVPAAAQNTDREFTSSYPGFRLAEGGSSAEVTQIRNLVSSQAPLASNDFRGNNTPRYMNREYDALVERMNGTIPKAERLAVVGQIARHISENLPVIGLYYSGTVTVFDTQLVNVSGGSRGNSTWNAWEWDRK